MAGCGSNGEEAKADGQSAYIESKTTEDSGNSIKIAIAGLMTGDNAEYGIAPSALTSQAYSSVYAFGAHAVLFLQVRASG